ncbi:MAG: ribonuclease HI [Sulfuriferula sp.]|nr:ribonuclease HI [Sulfuriferula sp.]
MSTTNEQAVVEAQPTAHQVYGMVIYTDGSCIPNPGFGGWGMHGYMYLAEIPKKGSGNPDHILAANGYMLKSDMAKFAATDLKGSAVEKLKDDYTPVTPVHYVDGFGSFEGNVTNNVAELAAAYFSLMHAQEYTIDRVLILTDSEYVRKGMDSWVTSWKKYGWKRSDGSEITNVEDWKRLSELTDTLRSKGVTVNFEWVKAHNDILGNVKADRLAMIGTCHSVNKFIKNEINTVKADGYWNYSSDKHPFLSHQCLYFNTRRHLLKPGEYYLGYHGDSDDNFGNRATTSAFSVIRLNNPDKVIEDIITHQGVMAMESDNLMKMLLTNIFKAEVHQELAAHGHKAMYRPNPYRYDLVGMDDEPLTTQFKPAKLAYRAVESIAFLIEKLDQFIAKMPNLVVTDLTPLLYETQVKTGKKGTVESMVLKEDLRVGFAALDVQANYKLDVDTGELNQEMVRLTLGIDLLDRNGLKRLESLNPKVSLITWMESPDAFRHATVIEADNGVGIWAGMYSNIRFLKDVAPAPVTATQQE